jgi:acylphosphatase
MGQRSVHVMIAGRVQGVGYRAWTAATARDLGLSGWVRNRREGTVEAVFEGTDAQLAEMLQRCRRGPRDANVTHIEVIGDGVGAHQSFEVRATV